MWLVVLGFLVAAAGAVILGVVYGRAPKAERRALTLILAILCGLAALICLFFAAATFLLLGGIR